MKCPHCRTKVNWSPSRQHIGFAAMENWQVEFQACPECGKALVRLRVGAQVASEPPANPTQGFPQFVYPRMLTHGPAPSEVPAAFAGDYTEACLVLEDSPKASAALSRRCLQLIIHEKAGIKKRTLNDEIDELLKSRQLPTHLAEDLDAIRNVGNFAAHPTKDTNTGEIVDVEPGEAEWLLNLIEGLFDFYFVQPAASARRRAALDAKLAAAGKPAMKVGS